ncbi:MAG: alanine racemase, partial [bacterium]|nr:alanine racemase [bacterium]
MVTELAAPQAPAPFPAPATSPEGAARAAAVAKPDQPFANLQHLAGPVAHIHTAAIEANAARFAAIKPLIAVVKADGFGHGMIQAAHAALRGGAAALGVATLDEAAILRSAGITAPILAWLLPPDADLEWAIRSNIVLACGSTDTLAAIARAAARTPTPPPPPPAARARAPPA